MLNKLAEKIKTLHLSYYNNIEIADGKLTVTIEEKPYSDYQLTSEIVNVISIIEKNTYEFEYDDDIHTLIITLK